MTTPDTMSEIVDRVARAIFIARSWQTAMVGDWDEVTEERRGEFRKIAIAAIEASGVERLVRALETSVEKLKALRTLCESSQQPFYVEIIDEVLSKCDVEKSL